MGMYRLIFKKPNVEKEGYIFTEAYDKEDAMRNFKQAMDFSTFSEYKIRKTRCTNPIPFI